MKISAVILSYNSIAYIEKCITSLVESVQEFESHEIFIVDNGSTDGSVAQISSLEERFPGVVGIYFEKNTGTTFSRNTALRKATGDLILIIDSDAYVNGEAIDYLSRYLSEHPECGIAAPMLTYPDGRYQKSVDYFPTLVSKFRRFFFLRSIESKESNQNRVATDVDTIISAFWLFRKDVLDKVGFLDEKIFYSPEDIDYCIRVWKSGYTVRYFPEVSVVHDAQEISRSKGFSINLFTLSHIKGLLYLFCKHGYFFGLSGLYRQIHHSQ